MFAVSLFAFLFLYQGIKSNIGEVQTLSENWQTENLRRDNVKSLASFLETSAPEVSQLEGHFVQKSDVVPFLDAVENLSKETNVKIEVSSVNVSRDNSSLMVEVKALGSFGDIYKFITMLENFPYELEFTTADVQNTSIYSTSADKNIRPYKWVATLGIKVLSFSNK